MIQNVAVFTRTNPGFVKLGQMLGKEKLFSYLDLFGFGSKTGVDLNGESEGIMFSMDKVGELELVTTAFGQGVSVTPIQQVTAVSSIVNGGKLYQPYVVKSLLEPETNTVIQENEPVLVRNTISEATSEKMRRALESVVALGGGKAAYIDGYRIGGKTGTTNAAGYCLVLYSLNEKNQDIISIVYKADGRSDLYLLMGEILSKFAN